MLAGLCGGCVYGSPPTTPTIWPVAIVTPHPEITLTVNTVYYEITGSDVGELRAQIDALGPADHAGRHAAYTEWFVHWRYAYARTEDACRVESLAVNLTVTLTLPHWTPPSDASPELVDQWQAYLSALRKHEDGHKHIATKAANEIATTLSSLPPHATCVALERAADAAGARILEQHRLEEVRYDRVTAHGAMQGARFP